MTVAKGLSSGYLPIGGVLVGDRVADVISTGGGEFAHGHTYSGHPVCCAAAIENLRILREEQVVERVEHEVTPAFRERWQRLGEHPLVREARSLGLMAAIELTPDRAARAPFPGEPGRAGRVCREICVENGLVMRAGSRHDGRRATARDPGTGAGRAGSEGLEVSGRHGRRAARRGAALVFHAEASIPHRERRTRHPRTLLVCGNSVAAGAAPGA